VTTACAGAIVGDSDAAGFASRHLLTFEHHNLEAALDQFVRGAHARDAAAEDDDQVGHALSQR
jgi:hypothetical protein